MKLTFWSWKNGKLWKVFITLIICMIASYQIYWQYPSQVRRFDSSTACNIPFIDPYSKSAKLLIEMNGKLDGAPVCINAPVKFKIKKTSIFRQDSKDAFWETVSCCYTVFRGRGTKKIHNGGECFPIIDEYTEVPKEHINLDIKCRDKKSQKVIYRDQLPIFHTNLQIESQMDKIISNISTNKEQPSPSVLILGLDSISHQNFVRYMPKSYNFLMDNLSALEFYGFNKVGSGTVPNLMALLSGCQVTNPIDPPYRVEDHCQFIWTNFAENGFRTLHFEDSEFNEASFYPIIRKEHTGVGTHYNLTDFMDGVRWIDKTEMGNMFDDGFGCYDNQFVLDVFADTIVHVAESYVNKSYLNFVWFGKTGHGVMLNTKYMDNPIHQILSQLNEKTLLNNTILIVVSDHGPWHGAYLATDAGALERLMPTLFVVIPDWIRKNYTQAFQNMKLNTKRLTTQFDLHETLMDLINLDGLNKTYLEKKKPQEQQLGQSLFLQVPLDRTCDMANIPADYCMCWTRSSISDPESNLDVELAATIAVIHINTELQQFPLCASVQLKSIVMASRLGSRFEEIKNNKDFDSKDLLEVRFTTSPANAEFQVTVSFKSKIEIIGQVLRTNVYKGQSNCISSWKNASYIKTMCLCI